MYNLHIPDKPSMPIVLSGPDILLTMDTKMQDALFSYVIELGREHLDALRACHKNLRSSLNDEAANGYHDCLKKCAANISAMAEWLAGLLQFKRETISVEECQGLLNCYANVIDAICYDDPYCLGMMTLESDDDAYAYYMDTVVKKIFAASNSVIENVFMPLTSELEKEAVSHG